MAISFVINHRSNNPKVTLNPPRQGLYGFVVKILATSDNSTPKRVTVMANGCQRSSMTTTTTTPNPYYNIARPCPSSENLLATPDANIRSIMANSLPVDRNIFRDNASRIGYTFPSTANQYTIDVNFLYPTTVDRLGILSGLNGTNVDTFDVTINQSPEYPTKSGRVDELVLSNANSTASAAGVTFTIKKTTDGRPPRNIMVYAEGCNQQLPQTKAQVEQGSSTVMSSATCTVTNILQPGNMMDFSSPHAIQDLTKAYENMKGVSFPLAQKPIIQAYFNDPVSISTVALQPTYDGLTTNIIKFSVIFITLKGDEPYIDPKTGKILKLTTADGDTSLTIQHDIIPNLKGIKVTVEETSGGRPTWFRLKVLGCINMRVTYIIRPTTTAPTTPARGSTTTRSKKCQNLIDLTQMSTLLFKQLLIQRRLQPSALALSSLTADSLPFQIDIDFNTEVTLELIRFVNGDQSKISRIAASTDMSDTVNSVSAKPNEIAFDFPIELVTRLTVQLLSTIDRTLPSNLKLEVLGCYDSTKPISTKAQIEDTTTRQTTFASNNTGSTIAESTWCPKSNILTVTKLKKIFVITSTVFGFF